MTDFADNIRRIVGVERDIANPKDLNEVGGIPSQRGIGSQGSGGGFESVGGQVVGGYSPFKAAAEAENKTKEGQESSSPINDTDQSTMTKLADAGVVDAAALIDGTAGPAINTADLESFDGISFDGGALSGIDALDCASGKALNIRTDGLFRPPAATYAEDGVTEITPAWTDPDVPPELLGYEAGFYWTHVQGGPTPSQSTVTGCAQDAGEQFELGAFIENVRLNSFDSQTATNFVARYDYDDISGGPPVPSQTTISGARSACSGTTSYCPVSPPTYTQWPDDDTISLSAQDAKYVTNSLDADATPEFTGQQSSHINFCMSGGRTGTIEAGIAGGNIIYETTSANGPPTGIIRYYASDGSFSGVGDASAGTLEMFRPNS